MELTNEEKNMVINILTQVRVPVNEAITIIKIIGKIKGSIGSAGDENTAYKNKPL